MQRVQKVVLVTVLWRLLWGRQGGLVGCNVEQGVEQDASTELVPIECRHLWKYMHTHDPK